MYYAKPITHLNSQEIVDEIDEDESGLLEFPEFVQLAAKFLIEEDEEQMKWELKEAFRIYDKHGEYILSNNSHLLQGKKQIFCKTHAFEVKGKNFRENVPILPET